MKHLNQIQELLSHYVFLMNHLPSWWPKTWFWGSISDVIGSHTNISSFNTIHISFTSKLFTMYRYISRKLASPIQEKNHGIWYFGYPYSKSECLKSFCLSNNGCLRPINCFLDLSGLSINHSGFVNSLSSAMGKRNKPYFYIALSNHWHCQLAYVLYP